MDECQCGESLFTDGRLCEACLEILARDRVNRVAEGKLNPLTAIASLLISAGRREDFEDEPTAPGRTSSPARQDDAS